MPALSDAEGPLAVFCSRWTAAAKMRFEFIGEPITIALDEGRPGKPPASFEWRNETYLIEAIEATWVDAGWGPLRSRSKRWWQRRHRTYFQVTARGQLFEIYHDRGLDSWTLYRRLIP